MTEQQLFIPAQIVNDEERVRNIDNYDKEYLVLLIFVDEDDTESRDFCKKKGRKECYEYLKDLVINERGFDVQRSKVLANGASLGEEINVGKFLRYVKDKYFLDDTDFDIDNYFPQEIYDIPEEDDILPVE